MKKRASDDSLNPLFARASQCSMTQTWLANAQARNKDNLEGFISDRLLGRSDRVTELNSALHAQGRPAVQ
jgi:hypothetical protein